MSSEAEADVSDELREVRNRLETKVNAAIANRDYGDGLREWAFIAMIFGDIDPGYKEVTRYSRNKKEYESRLRIDHAKFKAADFAGRTEMLCRALSGPWIAWRSSRSEHRRWEAPRGFRGGHGRGLRRRRQLGGFLDDRAESET